VGYGATPHATQKEHFFGSLKPFFAIEKKVSKPNTNKTI
jgi:hypothetical protein